MLRLILFSLFFSTTGSLCACICLTEKLSPEVFASYDFIAHIRVKYAGTSLGPWEKDFMHSDRNLTKYVLFETIRHYQGPGANWLIEASAFTSCAMGISANQEWMIYGIIDERGNILVHSCSNAGLYRLATGESSYRGVPGLEYAEQYCGYDPIFSLAPSGPDTIYRYFPNGQIEIIEPYYNGKKHGERLQYYPNRELLIESSFDEGVICGRASFFNSKGILEQVEVYNGTGHKIGKEMYTLNGWMYKSDSYPQASYFQNRQTTFYHKNGLPYQIDV
ncbi:MAG: hypothetical protein AAGA31_05780, partial [Bacteroidota bacterium]